MWLRRRHLRKAREGTRGPRALASTIVDHVGRAVGLVYASVKGPFSARCRERRPVPARDARDSRPAATSLWIAALLTRWDAALRRRRGLLMSRGDPTIPHGATSFDSASRASAVGTDTDLPACASSSRGACSQRNRLSHRRAVARIRSAIELRLQRRSRRSARQRRAGLQRRSVETRECGVELVAAVGDQQHSSTPRCTWRVMIPC